MRSRLAAAVFILCAQSLQVTAEDCVSSTRNDALVSPPAPQKPRRQRTLAKWLDALSFAESGNRAWIVHQDRDGRFYYGCLQFREKTFRFYVDKFGLAANDEQNDVMELIYDCSFQKRLARRMILDDPENWKHWRTTAGRIGLPPGATDAADLARRDRPDQPCPADNKTADNKTTVDR